MQVLGIDVGGTSVKFGVVDQDGLISAKDAFSTHEWEKEGFVSCLKEKIKFYLSEFEHVDKIGIGWPGLLSRDRYSVIQLANIPSVQNIDIVKEIQSVAPEVHVKMENDASCACLGEMQYGVTKSEDHYVMLTLGTGVGGGIIINRQLFIGGNGNAAEFGHGLSRNGQELEHIVGLNFIISYTKTRLINENPETLLDRENITPKSICEAAQKGDRFSRSVYDYLGTVLGEAIVGIINALDITTFVLAGGVAGAFDFLKPAIDRVIEENMVSYYTGKFKLLKSSLHGEIGLLGAASLHLAK